ncbi:MAG: dihydropteroate synthase [Planctomycetes bacterium]|nr:dihydropteroate synthase [Planctomycetota bacterium]
MSQGAQTRDLRLPASTCDGDGCRLKPRPLTLGRAHERPQVAVSGALLSPEEVSLLHQDASLTLSEERDHELVFELKAGAQADSSFAERLHAAWENATAPRPPPLLMGIVNATPDSFSDGGAYFSADDPAAAIEHALALVRAGCDLLDVGGESTRPGAAPVDVEEEVRRVVPIISALHAETDCRISVDTQKAAVAAAAIDAGATMVNDVSAGLSDSALLPLVAERGVELCLMHMQGTPRDMQESPNYADVVREVLDHLRERTHACLKAGIQGNKILLDPGIGFGKTLEHNLTLLRHLPSLRSLGIPLLLGVSRKSFIAQIMSSAGADIAGGPEERLGGTIAAVLSSVEGGASVLRVHDVAQAREALLVHRSLHPELH